MTYLLSGRYLFFKFGKEPIVRMLEELVEDGERYAVRRLTTKMEAPQMYQLYETEAVVYKCRALGCWNGILKPV